MRKSLAQLGSRPTILVLYRTLEYPLRATIADHLFSFRRYADADCIYVNVAFRHDVRRLVAANPDLVVFHTTLLSSRVRHERFGRLMDELQPLAAIPGVRVALPQDEHVHTEILSEFVRRLAVNVVYSVAPESEWPKIYVGVDTSRVAFERVLTGYLEPSTLRRVDRAAQGVTQRDIDIGYRVHGTRHSLGRHGRLKISLAEAFLDAARRHDVRVDISTRFEDTFLGDSWYRFLLRCRYVLGIEGGASVLDPDGAVSRRTSAYVAEHPSASFETIEAACFQGLDGALDLRALSPRHLEACATRTGQLLVEGDYNGILEPNVHYIPVARDLTGLSDVIDAAMDEASRQAMTRRAYEDIVQTGKYGYDQFVAQVLGSALGSRTRRAAGQRRRSSIRWFSFLDRMSWLPPAAIGLGVTTLHGLARHTPRVVSTRLRALERRYRGK